MELFKFFDGNAEEPGGSESIAVKKAYGQNKKQALGNIVLAVSDRYASLITSCVTVEAAWEVFSITF